MLKLPRLWLTTLRGRLSAAFLLIALMMAATGAVTVHVFFKTITDTVLMNAERLAHTIAYTGIDDALQSPEYLNRYLEGLDPPYHGVVVVDRERRVIAAGDGSQVSRVFREDLGNEVGQTMLDGRARAFDVQNDSYGGRHVVVALHLTRATASPTVGALIFDYTQIYDELIVKKRDQLVMLVSIALLGALGAGLFGVLVARRIGARLAALRRGVGAIADGDYAARVASDSRDEFGALARSFNQMAAELEQANAALLQHQQQLQLQVTQRTAELVEANELLSQQVAEGKRSAARIEHLAYYDGLTGLPNRSMFGKLLAAGIAQAKRHRRQLSVFFLDLDRFKLINDTLGHEAGDELLKEIGRRLRATLRESDIVARLGGDEFVVLIPEVQGVAQLEHVAQKLLSVISRSCHIAGQDFRVTGSVGIALYPEHGLDEQTLMKAADTAMYRAKEIGKNRYQVYSDELSQNSLHRLSMESALRLALERQEFRVHYQPKVDAASGRITGVEALVRWQHPELGMVSPMEFIPLAEETGLIVPIGLWVLRTACAQSVAWRRDGHDAELVVAVNLSARQFADDHLLQDITAVLQETGMDPRLLELEITESLLMHDVARAMEVLQALRAMQVRLALDDFGTGYSSLSTLKRFPLDTIKIDRSFIQDIQHDGDDRAITEAIIAMGQSLGLNVVAEGVETTAQISFLQARSCNELQGYYFSKPLPVDQCERLLRTRRGVGAPVVEAEEPALA